MHVAENYQGGSTIVKRNYSSDEVMIRLKEFDSEQTIFIVQAIFDHFLNIVSCDMCLVLIEDLTILTYIHNNVLMTTVVSLLKLCYVLPEPFVRCSIVLNIFSICQFLLLSFFFCPPTRISSNKYL